MHRGHEPADVVSVSGTADRQSWSALRNLGRLPGDLPQHDFRVDGLDLAASVGDRHPPVHAALAIVDVRRPSGDLGLQRPQVADAAATRALACHRAQLVLRNVQPAAVLRRVAKLDTAGQFPGPCGLERCV